MNIGKYYQLEKKLRYSVIDVGSGLMILLVFPNNYVVLFDCNVNKDSEESILDYMREIIPGRWDEQEQKNSKWIDLFICSHRDVDHVRGLKLVRAQFVIKEIWDSGQFGESTQGDEYKYYMELRRQIRKEYGDDAVKVPIPSINPMLTGEGVTITCINSALDFSSTKTYETTANLRNAIKEGRILEESVKVQHSNSLVLSLENSGFRLLLTGDSDWKCWCDRIVPKFKNTGLLKADVLIASHHGSRSFFTSESNETIDIEANPDTTYLDALSLIEPHMTLISCGSYKEYHHPNKEALQLYEYNTSNQQVYTTDKWGSFEGVVNGYSNWAIVPRMFKRSVNTRFNILATIDNRPIENGSLQMNSGKIRFRTYPLDRGFLEPSGSLKITWWVCNSGIHEDESHHEIYRCTRDELNRQVFSRDLEYEGQHLLLCYVHNQHKKLKGCQVFQIGLEK